MKLAHPYKCNYCPKLKGETNHWWLRLDAGPFVLDEWDDDTAAHEDVEHICSEQCAGLALSKWMAGAGREAVKT